MTTASIGRPAASCRQHGGRYEPDRQQPHDEDEAHRDARGPARRSRGPRPHGHRGQARPGTRRRQDPGADRAELEDRRLPARVAEGARADRAVPGCQGGRLRRRPACAATEHRSRPERAARRGPRDGERPGRRAARPLGKPREGHDRDRRRAQARRRAQGRAERGDRVVHRRARRDARHDRDDRRRQQQRTTLAQPRRLRDAPRREGGRRHRARHARRRAARRPLRGRRDAASVRLRERHRGPEAARLRAGGSARRPRVPGPHAHRPAGRDGGRDPRQGTRAADVADGHRRRAEGVVRRADRADRSAQEGRGPSLRGRPRPGREPPLRRLAHVEALRAAVAARHRRGARRRGSRSFASSAALSPRSSTGCGLCATTA